MSTIVLAFLLTLAAFFVLALVIGVVKAARGRK